MSKFKKFKFDPRIQKGYYSAVYFLKAQEILHKYFPNNQVTMQFFQRKNNVMLCGIDEVISLLEQFVTPITAISVEALDDGTIIQEKEPVLKITGPYHLFGYLEGIIDGILARRTSVANNCHKILQASNNKKVIFMFDRNDDYVNQQGDGYAAYVAQMKLQVTSAQTEYWNSKESLVGTMPHAYLHAFQGDIINAMEKYAKHFPNDKLVALVDFDNDVINTSLKVCQHFKEKLFAVRVDTSQTLIDKYFLDKKKAYFNDEIYGVNPSLIKALRASLDANGFSYVKIIVTSGFDEKKIRWFEQERTPADIYGVGAALGKINIHFTGDLVQLNGKDFAKAGRKNIVNPNLKKRI